MKKLKYLVAALLIGAVTLTGCGKKETISPEDAIKKAQNTMKTVDNYKMDMSVDAAIKAQGMSLEINFSLNGTIDEKNGKAKMTITANALGMDINTEMYTDTKSEEGKSITYTKQEDGTYVVTDKAILTQNSSNTITIALTNLNSYLNSYKVGQQIDIGTGSLGSRASTTEAYRTITKIEEYKVGGELKGQTITFDGSPIDIVAGSHGIWSCAQNTGSTDSLGMKSGYVGENGYSAVIYRGVENFFGNVYQFVDGINVKPNGEVYINYKPETYESDKFDGDYQKIEYALCATQGYVKTLGYDNINPLIAFTTETADSLSYIKDYFIISSGTHNRVGLVGGCFNYGTSAGAFCWSMDYSSSNSALYMACRVLK